MGSVARYHAPGRVNLIGEHTDYAGGLVLPTAIERGLTVDCVAAARIRLRSALPPGAVDVSADGAGEVTGFGRYVAALAAELAALGRRPVGIDGRIASDLPAGAGLASSAALLVAVALALCGAAGMELPPLELAGACRRAEERAVGVPCGIMDEAVSLLGLAGHALWLDCTTLAHRHVPLPGGLGLIVIDSGVRRRLAETGYATAAASSSARFAATSMRRPPVVCVICDPRTPASSRLRPPSRPATRARSARSWRPGMPVCATTSTCRRRSWTCWSRSRSTPARGQRG
jgi:galactokinase